MPYKVVEQWCKRHNATLMELGAGGFTYMTYDGMVWYMPYDEWEGAGA